jgi:hypothetical protein
MIKGLAAMTCLLIGCLSEQPYGAVAPTRLICKLGGFHQELALSPGFRIDRPGDDAYPSDDDFRTAFAADARAVAAYSKCPGAKDIGVLHLWLHRIESGSSRSLAGKLLSWTLFLFPTLGLSSIYPLTEERWLLVELDADVTVENHKLWTGEFAAFVRVPLNTPIANTGTQLTALIVRAQQAALKDLTTATESK